MVYSLGQALRCMLLGWALKMCDLSLLVRMFPSPLVLPRTYLFLFSPAISVCAGRCLDLHILVQPGSLCLLECRSFAGCSLEEKRIHSKCENLVFIPPPLSVGRRCRTDGPARSAEFTTTGLCWILAWVNSFSTLSRARWR